MNIQPIRDVLTYDTNEERVFEPIREMVAEGPRTVGVCLEHM